MQVPRDELATTGLWDQRSAEPANFTTKGMRGQGGGSTLGGGNANRTAATLSLEHNKLKPD
jgi:hypothetical protein